MAAPETSGSPGRRAVDEHLQRNSTNEGSVKRVSTTDWVRYGPQAEADMTLEGFILLGLIACQEAGEPIQLHDVLARLGRKALKRGCRAEIVRRMGDIARARKLPSQARTVGTISTLAHYLSVDDAQAEIDRALRPA